MILRLRTLIQTSSFYQLGARTKVTRERPKDAKGLLKILPGWMPTFQQLDYLTSFSSQLLPERDFLLNVITRLLHAALILP